MSETEFEHEIQELRKQVEHLTDKDTSGDDVTDPVTDEAPTDEDDPSLLKAKLDGLVNTIRKDLGEIPAATAIGIFALGVLVGRLLAK